MLRQKQTITKNSGFTLVEAIVTMIIMLSLMGIILTGLIQARQRFLVRNSAQQFADVIRQTIADTKNGIKVQDTACVPYTSEPRQCSNYRIRATSDNSGVTFDKYDKYVETTIDDAGTTGGEYADTPKNRSLQGGTAFENDFSLIFTYSGTTFPLVSINHTGGVGIPGSDGTLAIAIKSLSDTNIKANICILKSGSVLVQSDRCN
jgi:type II secretory pathway pseudopilin PulG